MHAEMVFGHSKRILYKKTSPMTILCHRVVRNTLLIICDIYGKELYYIYQKTDMNAISVTMFKATKDFESQLR